ncbi:hypothetical protein [uncultured Thiodictyon sp.]|uniref:hypothetical protein n=1 Tax=uncultured Thiodictyon sp. TaxID=1846217 RepID=UPI0025F1A138|nr:hypothetical protein [uncultured Thiodictyon sp.]
MPVRRSIKREQSGDSRIPSYPQDTPTRWERLNRESPAGPCGSGFSRDGSRNDATTITTTTTTTTPGQ